LGKRPALESNDGSARGAPRPFGAPHAVPSDKGKGKEVAAPNSPPAGPASLPSFRTSASPEPIPHEVRQESLRTTFGGAGHSDRRLPSETPWGGPSQMPPATHSSASPASAGSTASARTDWDALAYDGFARGTGRVSDARGRSVEP
jgi:hypothetical protein